MGKIICFGDKVFFMCFFFKKRFCLSLCPSVSFEPLNLCNYYYLFCTFVTCYIMAIVLARKLSFHRCMENPCTFGWNYVILSSTFNPSAIARLSMIFFQKKLTLRPEVRKITSFLLSFGRIFEKKISWFIWDFKDQISSFL